MTLFLLTALTVWSGLHVYLGWRLFAAFPAEGRLRMAIKLALAAFALAYPLGKIAGALTGGVAPLALIGPGAVWMGLAAISFAVLVPFDLLVTIPATVARRAGWVEAGTASSVIRYGLRACIALAVGLAGWGLFRANADPDVVVREVSVPRLPAERDGYRVAVLSDLHVGELVSLDHLERILAVTRAARPDLVILAGDLVEEPAMEAAGFDALAALAPAARVVAVTGNHELYGSNGRAIAWLRERGVPVLRNETIEIAGITVAGVDDPEFLRAEGIGPKEAVRRALEGADPSRPIILASHQPRALEQAAALGADLMVSGHTHGGQIPPFHVLTRLAFPEFAGLYRIDAMTLVVGRGAGFWGPPMRVFADPEIPLIVLRSPAVRDAARP